MALFRRKKSDKAPMMPPEVRGYYEAEKRDRRWLSWVLALGTLLVTVLVVLGIFYGGRWAYRKIRHQDKGNTPVAVQKDTSPTSGTNSGSSSSSSSSTPPSGSNSTSSSSSPSAPSSSSSTGGVVDSGAASTSLPNSGPEHMVVIFALTSLIATAGHSFVASRRAE